MSCTMPVMPAAKSTVYMSSPNLPMNWRPPRRYCHKRCNKRQHMCKLKPSINPHMDKLYKRDWICAISVEKVSCALPCVTFPEVKSWQFRAGEHGRSIRTGYWRSIVRMQRSMPSSFRIIAVSATSMQTLNFRPTTPSDISWVIWPDCKSAAHQQRSINAHGSHGVNLLILSQFPGTCHSLTTYTLGMAETNLACHSAIVTNCTQICSYPGVGGQYSGSVDPLIGGPSAIRLSSGLQDPRSHCC